MTSNCASCGLRWAICHCGDWKVVSRWGNEYVNEDWIAHQNLRAVAPKPAGLRTRKNGKVTVRRAARVGTLVSRNGTAV